MDELTKSLQRFLVSLSLEPELTGHQKIHYTEHLLTLLPADDQESLCHYFGIFGHEQLSLAEIAHLRGTDETDMMQRLDSSLRLLAVSPEWQMIQTMQ